MPEVLRQVIGDEQGAEHRPPGPVGERIALRRHQPRAERGRGRKHPREDQREHDQDGDIQPVVLGARHARPKLAPAPLVGEETAEDGDQGDGLEKLRVHSRF